MAHCLVHFGLRTPEAEGETRSTLGLGGGAPSRAPCLPVPRVLVSLLRSLYVGGRRPARNEQRRASLRGYALVAKAPNLRALKRRRRQQAAVASPTNPEEHVVTRLAGPAFRPCPILLALCGPSRTVRLLFVLRW
jgi:hypothetical protein